MYVAGLGMTGKKTNVHCMGRLLHLRKRNVFNEAQQVTDSNLLFPTTELEYAYNYY